MKSKIGAISGPTKWPLVQQKLKKGYERRTMQYVLLYLGKPLADPWGAGSAP